MAATRKKKSPAPPKNSRPTPTPPPTPAPASSSTPYRPLAAKRPDYRNVHILTADIDAYFAACESSKRPPTVTGLACWLGIDEQTWAEWATGRARTRDGHETAYYATRAETLKAAKRAIEDTWQARLFGQGQAAGAIFWLKNVAGWRDVQDINIYHAIQVLPDADLMSRLADGLADILGVRHSAPAPALPEPEQAFDITTLSAPVCPRNGR